MTDIKNGGIARHIKEPVVDIARLGVNFLLRLRHGNGFCQVVWVDEVDLLDELVVSTNFDLIIILARVLLIWMLFGELLHHIFRIGELLRRSLLFLLLR